MNKKDLVIFISLIIFSMNFASAYRADFAIYTGTGTWQESITAFEKFLDWKGYTYEEVSAWDINKKDLRPLYKGIFMPGGWAYNYKISLNGKGNQHIRDLISNGGVYIGMSAGAFYACDNVVWEGDSFSYPLRMFHGDCIGPIDEIAPWPNYVMTTMNINTLHEANIFEPAQRDVLYYGEPYFIANSGQEMQTFASWIVPSNPAADGKPGIIGFNYGNGRVLLVGPHPEIEEDDSRDGSSFGEELSDGVDGSDWPFLWTAMDWLFKKPISMPPANPIFQCSDGIDNDNDGFTDYPNDAGCLNFNDDDETDIISNTTTEIFFDDFESGNLNNWNVYGAGNPWIASTVDSYQGIYSAMSLQSGAGEPTYMETFFNSLNANSLTLEYQRKLIGLDSADSFSVEYFDSSTWKTLEYVTSTTDSSYFYKSFSLPSTTTGIRFMCETGAVSEMCFIDNVRITGV